MRRCGGIGRARGFSLIEVVVATAIIATTLGALFAVIANSNHLIELGQDRLIAAELSREQLETVRLLRDRQFGSSDCIKSIDGSQCEAWDAWRANTLGLSVGATKEIKLADISSPASLGTAADGKCGDYAVRSLADGTITVGLRSSADAGTETFCRRLFVTEVDKNTIQVRSQVAWLGYGKTTFQAKSTSGDQSCQASTSEWCTEETTLLTNWRVVQ